MEQSSLNRWKFDPEYIDLLNYFIEITKDATSPINVSKSVVDFKKKSGSSQNMTCLDHRIRRMRAIIHSFEHIHKNTKVKLLFALSAPVDAGFLNQLEEDAVVKVDDKQRITHYKANDGSLEFRGDHSQSAKRKTVKLESKRSLRSLIFNYFENKNDVDAVPKNKEEKEIWNLIEFITEKCENADYPLRIRQLARDFNKHFGTSRTFSCTHRRIRTYCLEIQTLKFLDAFSTVKQLFCLSATLDSEYLGKLRKDAVVEVDELNRITKYIANNGRLTLYRYHSQLTKHRTAQLAAKRSNRSERKNNKNVVMKHYISGDDTEDENDEGDGYSEDGNDEYSIEEFDSEFDLNNYDYHLDESEVLMEPSNEAVDFNDDIPVLSPTYTSMDDYFDFDPPTEKFHRSDEIEMREDEENYPETTGNVEIEMRKRKTTPPISNRWTTDSEYINLLNYLIQKAKDAKSPMKIQSLVKDFKEKSESAQTVNSLQYRIRKIGKIIHSFEHISTKTKVKLLFALSGSVNPEFLEELKKDAFVGVNYKQRIVYYKANDGSLELGDDRSLSAINITALFEPKRTYRSMLNGYFEKKNNPNAVPGNEEEKETGNLIEFIIEMCENIDRPLSISQLARDFVDKFQTSTLPDTVSKRIHRHGQEIQRVEFLTIHSRVKQLFGLSATVDSDFLERLRTEALVKIDEKNRITCFKSNDGSLELAGDHSVPAKNRAAQFETKRRYQSLMIGYLSPTYMSMDDYFDFDPPTERFHRSDEIEMMEVYGEKNAHRITGNAAVKTGKFEALPSTSQTPKRKADESAGSASSKRTKPLSEESMNLGEMDNNFFYEDPPRIDLNPFRGPLGVSDEIEEDSDIEQMPRKLIPQDKKVPVSKVDSVLSASLDIICT
ncbi:unnamed protein product [Caenorhabditis brenneri]